jgi:PAS domain-containing protein
MLATSVAAGGIVWMLVMNMLLYAATYAPRIVTHPTLNWLIVCVASVALYFGRASKQQCSELAALRAVVDSVGDGLLVLADRTIVYSNCAAVRLLGAKASELIGLMRRFLAALLRRTRMRAVTPDAPISQRAFTEPGPPFATRRSASSDAGERS